MTGPALEHHTQGPEGAGWMVCRAVVNPRNGWVTKLLWLRYSTLVCREPMGCLLVAVSEDRMSTGWEKEVGVKAVAVIPLKRVREPNATSSAGVMITGGGGNAPVGQIGQHVPNLQ